MSKKWPADIQGSLVITMSPGARRLWNSAASVCPAAASELMWPGVPVLAWATIRPRASKRPLARSPASRTIGLNAMRCRALACSLTIPIRLDQRISSSIPSTSGPPPRDDAARVVDQGVPTSRQDDRRLTFFDQRRAAQGLSAAEAGACVDLRRAGVGPERDDDLAQRRRVRLGRRPRAVGAVFTALG